MEFIKSKSGAILLIDEGNLSMISGYKTLLSEIEAHGPSKSVDSLSGREYEIQLDRGKIVVRHDDEIYQLKGVKK